MHEIMDGYYSGRLKKEDLLLYYVSHFKERVPISAPSQKIYSSYYKDGMQCLLHFKPLHGQVLCSERLHDFWLHGIPFTGVIDLTLKDDGIVIADHKSRALKQRSGRKTPTKSDEELDRYFRQLYLYANPVADAYGEYPSKLILNCYRTQERIVEPFDPCKLRDTNQWAADMVSTIKSQTEWLPDPEFCKCKYLCDVNVDCEYCQMEYGDPRRF